MVEDVVTIVGGDEALYGQPHAFAKEPCRDVSEIAAGYTDNNVIGFTRLLQLSVGVEIIEGLRQKASHVDGVGARQLHVGIQFLVHEGSLYQRLAIIKSAVYFEGSDVLSQGGELLLLYFTHLAFGVEHIDVDTLHTQETVPEYDFDNYAILEKLPEAAQTTFSEYTETPELLAENMCQGGEIKVGSHLLRSNCKITKQPDWGSVFIRLKAERLPAPMSLLRYIVSLRAENHFHEEICEMIYKRLHDLFQPEILSVSCLYTRRGGIDICPSRANRVEYLPEAIHDPEVLSRRLLRQ